MVVYITQNLVNGKLYIGKDTKNNPRYLGSGALLNKAIRKYGRENFKKTILQYCSCSEELEFVELFYIRIFNVVLDNIYYNILDSSTGGDSLTNHPDLDIIREKIKKARSKQIIQHSEATKKKIGDAQRGENGYWYNKQKPEDIKKRVSEKLKGVPKKTIQCIYCDKVGSIAGIKRWHMENCSIKTGIKHLPTNKKPWNKGLQNPYSEETLKRMSDSHKGQVPWNKNK